MEHDLKTWPEPFAAVLDGRKRYEVRVDDRGYEVGDVLHLLEYEPDKEDGQRYTGRAISVRVTYKTLGGAWGIPDHLCVMSIEPLKEPAVACRHREDALVGAFWDGSAWSRFVMGPRWALDAMQLHRLRCTDCAEWLPLGAATETAETAIEVRAAELMVATHGIDEREFDGLTAARRDSDYVADADDFWWWAGWLAYAIHAHHATEHGEG